MMVVFLFAVGMRRIPTATLVLTVDGHVEERPGEAAAGGARGVQFHAVRQERGEAREGGGRIGDELQQRGGEHVAGGAGFELQVERLHGSQ